MSYLTVSDDVKRKWIIGRVFKSFQCEKCGGNFKEYGYRSLEYTMCISCTLKWIFDHNMIEDYGDGFSIQDDYIEKITSHKAMEKIILEKL